MDKYELYITDLIRVFSGLNPAVRLGLSYRDGVYYVTIDYGFKELPADVQKRARTDINSLMRGINSTGVQSELTMGIV